MCFLKIMIKLLVVLPFHSFLTSSVLHVYLRRRHLGSPQILVSWDRELRGCDSYAHSKSLYCVTLFHTPSNQRLFVFGCLTQYLICMNDLHLVSMNCVGSLICKMKYANMSLLAYHSFVVPLMANVSTY